MTKIRIPVSGLIPTDQVLRATGAVMYTVQEIGALGYSGIWARVLFPPPASNVDYRYWASGTTEVNIERTAEPPVPPPE